ncbi:small ribosomal subunit protein bS1m [Trichomonascus vanleenenianus]|uniref:mitochondrial 37S ribosomal protein bS1m MRP51 n=1 Tax=Trichomonascus vanleenenianus TaxID=2268995 RepID=UPI003EC9EB7F
MEFQSLLRSSRLSSLSGPLKRNTKSLPTHQVVATTPSSFHRRDWGLKAPIPAKHQSLYVNVGALDSMESIAQYESGSGNFRRLQRFREFGIPVDFAKNAETTNFFEAKTNFFRPLKSMEKRHFSQRLDAAKKSRVATLSAHEQPLPSKNRNLSTTASSLESTVKRELKIETPAVSNPKDQSSGSILRPALGLNYSLKGSLRVTPTGISKTTKVPGRIVSGRSRPASAVAVGGFICNAGTTNTYQAPQATASQPVIVRYAKYNREGVVEVNVNLAMSKSSSFKNM